MKSPIAPTDMTDSEAVHKFLQESAEYQATNLKNARRNFKVALVLFAIAIVNLTVTLALEHHWVR